MSQELFLPTTYARDSSESVRESANSFESNNSFLQLMNLKYIQAVTELTRSVELLQTINQDYKYLLTLIRSPLQKELFPASKYDRFIREIARSSSQLDCTDANIRMLSALGSSGSSATAATGNGQSHNHTISSSHSDSKETTVRLGSPASSRRLPVESLMYVPPPMESHYTAVESSMEEPSLCLDIVQDTVVSEVDSERSAGRESPRSGDATVFILREDAGTQPNLVPASSGSRSLLRSPSPQKENRIQNCTRPVVPPKAAAFSPLPQSTRPVRRASSTPLSPPDARHSGAIPSSSPKNSRPTANEELSSHSLLSSASKRGGLASPAANLGAAAIAPPVVSVLPPRAPAAGCSSPFLQSFDVSDIERELSSSDRLKHSIDFDFAEDVF